jgi:hypothetical protein
MSEWPKRYDLTEEYDGYYDIMLPRINPVEMGKYVEFEDFERLLNYAADVYYGEMSHIFEDLNSVKTFIIDQIKEEIKNDR